jgi:hypothetical protein
VALNADPENQGPAQINKAIVQVKAKAEADKKRTPRNRPTARSNSFSPYPDLGV